MAERKAKGTQRPAFDMRWLRRLALWGASATAALALAVLTAYSPAGSQRLQPALSRASGDGQTGAPMGDRAADMVKETQRLSEAERALTEDRDKLLSRIATLERDLEDVTGATRRLSDPARPETVPRSAPA